MSWTGYCVQGDHANCPDHIEDSYECDCPHHLTMDHVLQLPAPGVEGVPADECGECGISADLHLTN